MYDFQTSTEREGSCNILHVFLCIPRGSLPQTVFAICGRQARLGAPWLVLLLVNGFDWFLMTLVKLEAIFIVTCLICHLSAQNF